MFPNRPSERTNCELNYRYLHSRERIERAKRGERRARELAAAEGRAYVEPVVKKERDWTEAHANHP
jgi:hypothetical protein